MNGKRDLIHSLSMIAGIIIIFFIVYPICLLVGTTDYEILGETIRDNAVRDAIWTSLSTGSIATLISAFLGVPLAYILARFEFKGKNIIESILDIPLVIPHTVVGIMLLSMLSSRSTVGKILEFIGVEVIGTKRGIVLAMMFVSLPLMISSAKNAFLGVSSKMENVSRSLGATHIQTIKNVTLPNAYRGILTGMILTWARSISEFGAVVILAYHPMIAPTIIFDRFNSYGLKYSKPISLILIIISLIIFMIFRMLTMKGDKHD
jgi:molybdate/tungstate transport system permease protein